MGKEKAKGKGRQLKGKVQEKIGDATGDTGMKVRGKGEQLKGKAQEMAGEAADAVRRERRR
ncbi:CsbD family protein [Streptomyces sp. BI20]|uniref:CsbD family protein n=1 Tax=Streptomyces sp. BI20 TaxID=3403460 RepID=UPI003C70B2CD